MPSLSFAVTGAAAQFAMAPLQRSGAFLAVPCARGFPLRLPPAARLRPRMLESGLATQGELPRRGKGAPAFWRTANPQKTLAAPGRKGKKKAGGEA